MSPKSLTNGKNQITVPVLAEMSTDLRAFRFDRHCESVLVTDLIDNPRGSGSLSTLAPHINWEFDSLSRSLLPEFMILMRLSSKRGEGGDR